MKIDFEKIITSGEIIENAPMKEYTSFKAGGNADVLIIPGSEEELTAAVRAMTAGGMPFVIMGNGSNILVRDGGYRGAVVKTGECFNYISGEGPVFRVGAAVSLAAAAKYFLDREYTGFEFASGIPGSMGGAAFMNAGAYDGEMKNIIRSVTLLKRDGSEKTTLSADEMDYGYRHSILYDTGDIIIDVELELKPGNRSAISERMKELTDRRNTRQPVNYPSAGSFFKRPAGHYAGGLIQEAGLKGLTVGGAQVSQLHAGFIINTGGAKAADIIELMHLVQARVQEKSGVLLEPEVRLIGEE